MKFAVHQPNFCPWLGYFAKMCLVDHFVMLDDVQMPVGRSYVSRSKIRGGETGTWLSVSTEKSTGAKISEVRLSKDHDWRSRHLGLLRDRYRAFEHFDAVFGPMEEIYQGTHESLLELNLDLIQLFRGLLDVATTLSFSSDHEIASTSDQRIADIGERIGATHYYSGMGGTNYQTAETYGAKGIELSVFEVKKESIQGLTHVGYSVIDNLMEAGPQQVAAELRGIEDRQREG